MNHLHTLDICTLNRNIESHYSGVFLRECTNVYNLYDFLGVDPQIHVMHKLLHVR